MKWEGGRTPEGPSKGSFPVYRVTQIDLPRSGGQKIYLCHLVYCYRANVDLFIHGHFLEHMYASLRIPYSQRVSICNSFWGMKVPPTFHVFTMIKEGHECKSPPPNGLIIVTPSAK